MSNVLRGARLLEVDFSAIEAKLTGWYARDPEYIRLATLGVHGALCTYIVGKPYDPADSDADLMAQFKAIKKADYALYDRAKHAVYGDLYGQTDYGLMKLYPKDFPTLTVAKRYKTILHAMAPGVPRFQGDVRQIAYDQNYLGGAIPPQNPSNAVAQILARNPSLAVHPFGYKHHFWSVIGYRKIPYSVYQKRLRQREAVAEIQGQYYAVILGEDAKRVVAFFPQSTAAAILTEVLLRLFDPDQPTYIGDAYYGRTPLRAPIHDSLLMEIPNRIWDRVVATVVQEMLRPIPQLPLDWIAASERQRLHLGEYLQIGVEAKAGYDWGTMTVIEAALGVSGDATKFPIEDDDDSQEEFEALGTSVA
jgi:hypothetical protein